VSRPREPLADAMRLARAIVATEGAALAHAARGGDEAAIEAACHHLTLRIAQALADAEREASERLPDVVDEPLMSQFAMFVRATH
jgi:hypothetical protein